MAQNLTVGYEGLQQSASQLQTGRQELVSILRNLQSVIDNLTTGGFKTRVASGRFSGHYRQWDRGTAELLSTLDDLARAIREAQQKHEQADSALAEGASGLGGTAR